MWISYCVYPYGRSRNADPHALSNGFLSKILGRPENEKPFLLLPVGYPATDGTVPNIQRKNLDEISDFI
tara:strand:- start:483 stop:689 length:207 start_codon:yes stop_codon:yes gene_type:complete